MIDKLEKSVDPISGVDVRSLHLDGKLIIVDEAHTLLVGMSNGSANASALYDKLMQAKRCRIILMTASGVVNTIFEAVLALNICKGYLISAGGERTPLLPESAEDFKRLFVDEKTAKLKQVDKLRMRIRGLVSYHGDLFERKMLQFFPMLNTRIVKDHYPDRLPVKVVSVPMSSKQYAMYSQAREKEKLESRNSSHGGSSSCQNEASGGSSTYRIRSRQISNVLLDDGSSTKPNQYDDICTNVEIRAPKLKAIGDRIKPGRKALIYSNFVQAGIDPIAAYLEHLGYRRYIPSPTTKSTKQNTTHGGDDQQQSTDYVDDATIHEDGIHGMYGVYSGAVTPEDRTTTLKEYNNPNSPLTILLISSSGAEGLSTMGTRDVHIMEPYWNIERILQVMACGIRFRSHSHLPPAQRTVQVYMYLATAPRDIQTKERTTDLYLFMNAARKYEINGEMIRLMARRPSNVRNSIPKHLTSNVSHANHTRVRHPSSTTWRMT
ncbi:hypothetical protein JG688_00009117 [Phytophthora aleatoria]|uniref:Helicase C-terminal domain-containing protein n=1 Tax=Phytophthora aleatoria TaxID=2496075 RepID=A0A8J5IRU0_9STRA|nr:hypothetical protein JG688_00009117 [Phytophthora aleatoria]